MICYFRDELTLRYLAETIIGDNKTKKTVGIGYPQAFNLAFVFYRCCFVVDLAVCPHPRPRLCLRELVPKAPILAAATSYLHLMIVVVYPHV